MCVCVCINLHIYIYIPGSFTLKLLLELKDPNYSDE